jgi:hypothetical protein
MTLIARVFLLLAMTTSIVSCATQTQQPAAPVPWTYFGLHIHRLVHPQPWLPNGDRVTSWPEVKFGSWRLWDAYVAWPNLEPEKGKWNFSTLDKYVAMAGMNGVDLLLPLGLTPGWASARPREPSAYRPGNAAEPANMEDWRNYVHRVATRYKGRIRRYELWNEVNYPRFYSGSQEKLIEMARIAYETIKAIDPEAIVVSPSVTGSGRHLRWFETYLAKGGGLYADVIGYHFYVPKDAPEAMLPLIREVQAIMRKYGQANKPLWNTETGWWIANRIDTARTGAVNPDWRKLDEQLAAAYVARALILARSAGVDRFYWYAWDNVDMGLIEPATQVLKPAAKAYDTVASWLIGKSLEKCDVTGGLWTCPLIVDSKKKAWLMWSDADTLEWPIPPSLNAVNIERLDGRRLSKVSGRLTVGPAPVLLIAADL